MLLNAFNRLEFDPFVCMLHSELIIVFDQAVRFTSEIERLPTQLGNHLVNQILTSVIAQDIYL